MFVSLILEPSSDVGFCQLMLLIHFLLNWCYSEVMSCGHLGSNCCPCERCFNVVVLIHVI